MRARFIILGTGLVLGCTCRAQWAVFDVANLQQSVVNHAAMVEQLAKEGEQIANQVRQIQQMEDRLKRMGNMAGAKIKAAEAGGEQPAAPSPAPQTPPESEPKRKG